MLKFTATIGAALVLMTSGAVAAQQASFNLDQARSQSGAQQDSQTQSIPQAEAASVPSNPALEIPSAYLGCWEGAPRADAWHQYSGPRIEGWVPSTVTLCFAGTASGVEVTYHKQSLDEAVNQGRIVNSRSRTVALGSAGERIALRSYGSAQERGRIFGLFNGPTIDIKWMADANCTLLPDRQTMLVEESMNQFCSGTKRCNGGPFVSAVWHGTFHRTTTP